MLPQRRAMARLPMGNWGEARGMTANGAHDGSRQWPVGGWRLGAFLAGLCLMAVSGPAIADGRTRLAGATYIGDLPTLVADRQGLFREAGIDATVTYAASGSDNLARLRAGDVDYALMALTPVVLGLLNDRSPGGPGAPVILANLFHATGATRVMVPAHSSLSDAGDLAGRRVGLARGTSAHFVWWLFAQFHGLDTSENALVDIEIDALGDALIAGEIDAAVLWQPWIARLGETRSVDLRRLGQDVPYSGRWVIVTRRAVLREDPERARRILVAYRRAIEFIERRPDTAARLYADHAGVTIASLGDDWNAFGYDLSLDWALVAALQQQLAWARQAGYPVHGSAGVMTVVDTEALRAVAPGAVGLPATIRSGGARR